MRVTEGYMPYLGYRAYYRIAEPDRPVAGRAPIVLLHGGPGSTHDYLETLDPLADRDGRTLVTYDQIGCGRSWDDAMADHPELWVASTWVNELAALREHLGLGEVHLLGQSWGGATCIIYLCDHKPAGVRSVVLSSTLASSRLWGEEGHRRLRYLSDAERDAFARAERTGDFDDPAFQAALARYMELFCSGPVTEDSPECLRRPKRTGRESYVHAWGDNELMPSGTLRDYDYSDRLGEISCPALVIDGTQDLCSPLIAKQMYDAIPNARWEIFPNCRHMCYVDDNPRYLALLQEWLDGVDEGLGERG
jgi:proline iminopeptidase